MLAVDDIRKGQNDILSEIKNLKDENAKLSEREFGKEAEL